MKYLPLIFILVLTGCATDVERIDGLQRIEKIQNEFKIFENNCRITNGYLYIDKDPNRRRVQNAPITVWEMQDAVCDYGDMHPVRMSNDY